VDIVVKRKVDNVFWDPYESDAVVESVISGESALDSLDERVCAIRVNFQVKRR